MALIFLGLTKCGLCGKIFLPEDAITGLPSSAAKDHPLHKYFDCGFHTTCFDKWDMKEEALKIVEDERQAFINSAGFKDLVEKHGRPSWLNGSE